MDEGTRAIIRETAREINDIQYGKIEKIVKEHNEYLNERFIRIEEQIENTKNIINEVKTKGCGTCLNHLSEHEKKEKRIIKNATITSTTIPTIILLISWIKSIIIGWMQKPPSQ